MKIFIGYASTDGQTARIAQRITARLYTAGAEVTIADVGALPEGFDLRVFDAIALGGSVRLGGYQRRLSRFVRNNLETLRARPSAFFSVCLAINSRFEKDRAEAHAIPERWLIRLGWAPSVVEVIAGAALFTHYGLLTRWVMKKICEREMGPVDVHRDYVLTAWDQVDAFAERMVFLAGGARAKQQLGLAPEAEPQQPHA